MFSGIVSSSALLPGIKYMQTVWDGKLEESCWRPFTLMYFTRFRTYKNSCPPFPRQNSRRGGGLKQINSCCKVLLQFTFKTKRCCIAFYASYPSTSLTVQSLRLCRKGDTLLLKAQVRTIQYPSSIFFDNSPRTGSRGGKTVGKSARHLSIQWQANFEKGDKKRTFWHILV